MLVYLYFLFFIAVSSASFSSNYNKTMKNSEFNGTSLKHSTQHHEEDSVGFVSMKKPKTKEQMYLFISNLQPRQSAKHDDSHIVIIVNTEQHVLMNQIYHFSPSIGIPIEKQLFSLFFRYITKSLSTLLVRYNTLENGSPILSSSCWVYNFDPSTGAFKQATPFKNEVRISIPPK